LGTRKQGRHWSALEARSAGRRPKAGTGLHWGHGLHWGTGVGSAGRRPALACTGARSAGRRPALGTECPAVGRHWPALGHGVPGRRPARRYTRSALSASWVCSYKLAAPRKAFLLASICHAKTDPPVTNSAYRLLLECKSPLDAGHEKKTFF